MGWLHQPRRVAHLAFRSVTSTHAVQESACRLPCNVIETTICMECRGQNPSIYKAAASVCLSVCVSVFRISQKRADRFPWNFSSLIGVIGRRERIKKTSGKFRPLMCKISENGAKLPTSRKSPRRRRLSCAVACGPSSRARLRAGRWYDSGTGQSRAGLGA